MPKPAKKLITRKALLLKQNKKHALYQFSLSGEELLAIAEISRVSRDDDGKLLGYQRAGVKQHIKDIVEYLESPDIVFPNSIILAFSSKVRFKKSRGPQAGDDISAGGTLEIPIPRPDEPKPAWIVDGQQRALALSISKRKSLPVPVNAFVADDIELQRDQFLRVNNTKPLPRGLITELLPEVSTPLPARLAARKIPAELCELLSSDKASPFYGLIRRASSSAGARKKAVITDTAVITMLHDSLASPSGCLFPCRNIATGETDFEEIWSILLAYWNGVKRTFPDAWGRPPTKSRLMHGAGIIAMGRLMDRVIPKVNLKSKRAVKQVEKELQMIVPLCHWTSGNWEELGGLAWNDIQNVPRHISLLSSVLIRGYLHAPNAAA